MERRISFLRIVFGVLAAILSRCEALNTKIVTPAAAAGPPRTFPRTSTSSSSTASTRGTIHVRSARPYRPYTDDDGHDELEKERTTERPTQTRTEALGPSVVPPKPKIVVLGASGLIGRLVVRQLLEMSELDATIVAFVRDYDKACRVLYDDLLVASSSVSKRGPKLQIVQGDLVPPEELPGYDGTGEEEQAWLERAESAAASYGKNVKDYDNREGNEVAPDEALQEAIRDCTAIISCVGAVRPTNPWTDLLARPLWRLLRSDVSAWCSDPRHPFYVHYHATRKVLRLAEREQLRREAAVACDADNPVDDDYDDDENTEKQVVPRIRFVRISDLCVAQAPWNFVPVLTNILHSMVFRYQDMAEKALEASSLIETVTIRPGDLVDEERDANTTSLQVDPSGTLPCPARVGRDDVAALAVASALFDSSNRERRRKRRGTAVALSPRESSEDVLALSDDTREQQQQHPFHYTLACRWASDSLDPYPAQGQVSDGLANANLCLQSALQTLRKQQQQQQQKHYAKSKSNAAAKPRRKIKPYGICVAVPVYIVLALMVRSLLGYAASLHNIIPALQCLDPIASRMCEALSVTAASVLGHSSLLLHAAGRHLIPALPLWVRWRYSAKYISF